MHGFMRLQAPFQQANQVQEIDCRAGIPKFPMVPKSRNRRGLWILPGIGVALCLAAAKKVPLLRWILYLFCAMLGINPLPVGFQSATVFLFLFGIFSLCSCGKDLVIGLISIYQKLAPNRVRALCLFTPCCSEYMQLAVQKYGVIRGVTKGIRRIRRCRPPEGGVDFP